MLSLDEIMAREMSPTAYVRAGELQLTKTLPHHSAGTPSNRPSLTNGTGITTVPHGGGSPKEMLHSPWFFSFTQGQK